MKVLHVMGRFAASGAERQLASTLRAAVSHDFWEPTLLILRGGSPFASTVSDAGIRVVEIGYPSDRDPRRLSDLRTFVRREGFDVVHSTLRGANVMARTALIGVRRPAIVVSERRVEDFRSDRARTIDRALRRVTDHYIGNSQAVKDFICRYHGVDEGFVSVIVNGIDTTVFHPLTTSRPPRPIPRIGGLGRLVPLKGFDVLIEALRLLLERRDAEVVIAGDGPEHRNLAAQASGLPVRFIGPIESRGDVACFLRDLDLFVLPSYAEGLPNVVLEAAACGVPVAATDAPGMAEAIPGISLAEPGDPMGLANAMEAALARERSSETASVAQSFTGAAVEHMRAFESSLRSSRVSSRKR